MRLRSIIMQAFGYATAVVEFGADLYYYDRTDNDTHTSLA